MPKTLREDALARVLADPDLRRKFLTAMAQEVLVRETALLGRQSRPPRDDAPIPWVPGPGNPPLGGGRPDAGTDPPTATLSTYPRWTRGRRVPS